MSEYLVYIFPPLFAAFGAVVKGSWDHHFNNIKKIKLDKINQIQNELNVFYLPLYQKLQREDMIWKKIAQLVRARYNKELLDKYKNENISPEYIELYTEPEIESIQTQNYEQPDELTDEQSHIISYLPGTIEQIKRIREALDKETLISHIEIQLLIHNNLIVIPDDLKQLIKKLDEHITLFTAIRSSGIKDKWPGDYGSKYPTDLYKKLEVHIKELFKKLDKNNNAPFYFTL